MEYDSYWSSTCEHSVKRPELSGSKKFDVAIIGAGFTGLSTSLFLQEKGYQTAVIEQSIVGGGASGRNGSLMLIGYKSSLVSIAKKYGNKVAKSMLDTSLQGIELVKKVSIENNIKCDLKNKGSFNAAYKPSHFEKLKREQEFMLEKLDYENFIIEKKDIQGELDSPIYHGGLVDPNSYYFNPLKYTLGLADAVEQKGGVIFENSKAETILKKNGVFHINTSNGKIEAKELVIATNGYTTELNKDLHKRVIPMNSNMLATEILEESIADTLIPNRRGVFDTKNLLYYFRLSEDNRLLFGSRLSGKENDDMYERLREMMVDVFPQLNESKIDYRWGGKVGISRSMFPHVGVNKDGSHSAFGYSGHGVSLSTLMGKIIANNISDNGSEKNVLESLEIKKFPFHHQKDLMVNLATNFFKIRDIFS